jgi:hypothetical protein
MNELIFVDLFPQVFAVRLDSVSAGINPRNYCRYHLPLCPTQFGGTEHDGLILINEHSEAFRLDAEQLDDVVNSPGALDSCLIFFLDDARCL